MKRIEIIERIQEIMSDDFQRTYEKEGWSSNLTAEKIVSFLEDIGYDSTETLIEKISNPNFLALNDPNASWNQPK